MAGKTGTTNENRDAWFIGYTPDIVTGVFIGNDDNTSTGLTGGTAPARIWKEMMTVVTQKYGATEFDYKPIEKGDWVDNKKPAVVIKTEDAKAGNWAFDDDDNDVKEVIKRPEKKENEAENGIKNKKKNINEIDYKLPPIQPVTITPTEVEIDNFRSIPVQLNDNLIKKE